MTAEGLFKKASFPIGVAVNTHKLNSNHTYRKIVTEQFNAITAENIFKASYLQPKENDFCWTEADQLVTYCESNQKRLHGHTLIWHQNLPSWITNYQGNSTQWQLLFKNHIKTIIAHFKGKVKSWDVVNEAFNEDGTFRPTIWLEKIGEDYIEKAFKYAREADPESLLFYNDYSLELNRTKRKAVLDLLEGMKMRGVSVDGIGMQMHISINYPDMQQVTIALKEISDRGYKIHLSELDIAVNPFNKKLEGLNELFIKQADILNSIVHQYQSIPAELRFGITLWGVGDGDSWIRHYYNREDYPLLFDDNYEVKPIYQSLVIALINV